LISTDRALNGLISLINTVPINRIKPELSNLIPKSVLKTKMTDINNSKDLI